MAVVIRTDGSMKPLAPSNGDQGFSLAELKDAIGGGWIEMVRLAPVSAMAQMGLPEAAQIVSRGYKKAWLYLIVDEEGLLKHLPVNRMASALYQLTHHTSSYIVGDALLCVVTGKLNKDDMEIIV